MHELKLKLKLSIPANQVVVGLGARPLPPPAITATRPPAWLNEAPIAV